MTVRSILIGPAFEPAAVERALAAKPGAVLLDLAGAPADIHDAALACAVEMLGDAARIAACSEIWVGLSPFDAGRAGTELRALCPLKPDAFVLPGVGSAADVQQLGAMLAVAEAEAGLDDGASRIVAMTETAACLFELIAIAQASRRLRALVWDGEALARDLGAEAARDGDGRWTDPLQTARTLLLAACADAGLPAIDAVFSMADDDAYRREAETARRDGFAAKLALTVNQARIAEEVFSAGR